MRYYYTFFKIFFNISISVSRIRKAKFLDLKYKQKDLIFRDKKLEERE